MPLFPAFLDLSKSTVLVVGQGHEADSKAEKMAPFCARVERCPYPPVYEEVPALVILAGVLIVLADLKLQKQP